MIFLRWSLAFLIGVGVLSAAAPNREFRDAREYDLSHSALREGSPPKRLELLKKWLAAYPISDFSQERYQHLITTYQAMGQSGEMLSIARLMAKENPDGLGNYWIATITVARQDTSPRALSDGNAAAGRLVAQLNWMYSAKFKPDAVSTTAWVRQRNVTRNAAFRTLGWVALQRKNWKAAIHYFHAVLEYTPADAEVSFWLGESIQQEGGPKAEGLALYHYARAASVAGGQALSASELQRVRGFVQDAYKKLNGSEAGLEKLYRLARLSPFPPKTYVSRAV